MEKILKYLLKGQMINATMNVSLKSITDALDVNVCGRWKLCSHLFENIIQQLLATFHQSEHETFLWQKSKLLTCLEICWQNLLTKCESSNKKNLLTKKSADERNLLTKIESADNQKTVPAQHIKTSSWDFASRQPGHGWRAHSFGQIQRLYMCLGRAFLEGPPIRGKSWMREYTRRPEEKPFLFHVWLAQKWIGHCDYLAADVCKNLLTAQEKWTESKIAHEICSQWANL